MFRRVTITTLPVVLTVVLTAVLTYTASVTPAASATLREVVQKAVDTHPEVGALRANRRAISQELRATRGQYLPSIDARASIGHQWLNSIDTRYRASRPQGKSGWDQMNRYEAGVDLRQLVFDGFGTTFSVKRNISRVYSARYRVEDTANAIALRAVEAYLEIQRTGRIIAISQRNIRIHRAILRRVRARSVGGRGPRSDVDQALARLSLAQTSLTTSRAQYNDAVALFIQAVGERPKALAPASAPVGAMPTSIQNAVNAAVTGAPSVKAASADVAAARSAIGVAKSRFYPRVDVQLSYSHIYEADGVSGSTNQFVAQLIGSWNLYRGGIDTARRREAVARMIESRDLLEQTRREVAQQTRLSWNALKAARERQVAVRRQLSANRRVRLAYSRQFDRGQRTLLDLVDIQNEIFNNETVLVTEKFTIKFGIFRTLASMGKLVAALNITLPSEAVRPPKPSLFHGASKDIRSNMKFWEKGSRKK